MSAIGATVKIVDGMSPALKSMMKTLDSVLNSFEELQNASGNSIDVSEIDEAKGALLDVVATCNELVNELRSAGQQNENLRDGIRSTESAMGGLVKKALSLVAAYGSMQTVMSLVELSDQASQTESRLNLIVDVENGETLDDLEQKIMDSANRSRASYTDTADAVVKLANNAGNAFSSNDEIIAFLEAVNKQFVIGGADASAMAGAMTQLSQGLAAGALRGDELNSVLEGAPGIARAIEESMGWAQGSIKQYAEEGLVTAEVVKNAMLGSLDSINEDFETMPMTWAQMMTVFKNNAVSSLEPVLSKVSELANNQDVQNFVLGLTTVVATAANVLLWVFESIASVGTFMYENWVLIAPVIWAIVSALAAYGTYLVASNAIEAVNKGIKIASMAASYAKAAATRGEASATAQATAAQYSFNTALLSSPLTWILVIIIAVIAAIYLIVAAINKVTGSSVSATGIIVGALATAGAFIWNLFLGILDVALAVINHMYNKFAMFANFFANLFNDPIASVIHLFGDMADAVLAVLESVAKAMDKVFGSSLASTVSGWRSSLDSMVEEAANKHGNGSYEKVVEELNLSSESLGLERISYEDAWSYGYEAGENVEDKLADFSVESLIGSGEEINSSLTDLVTPELGDISDSTDTIADAVEITEEDLKYLRDIAEQEAINRFTTAEIKIDMQNTNTISSDMDIDGFVSRLEDKLYESMEIAAEGVH